MQCEWHRVSGVIIIGDILMGVCTMGVATRGSTLSEELCLKLGFELDRGKRDFLITGPLASGASTWKYKRHKTDSGTQDTSVHTHTQTRMGMETQNTQKCHYI